MEGRTGGREEPRQRQRQRQDNVEIFGTGLRGGAHYIRHLYLLSYVWGGEEKDRRVLQQLHPQFDSHVRQFEMRGVSIISLPTGPASQPASQPQKAPQPRRG